ncbi:MAG TPA: YaaR family protein [Spirochaetia bacterium]|nr:YaaR family protein [Spirochaetales bacterium]HRY72536.1 YaaR family protein [Spirochaetia bacterium]
MAKIDFPEGLPNPFAPMMLPKRREDEKKAGKSKGLFRTSLGKALDEARAGSGSGGLASEPFSEAALESLLDEVHEAGDRLKENANVDAVQAYKKSVRDFVHYVVEKSYSVEERTSGGSILKRKKFYLVAVIDESLERLAAEILRNQRDKLEILRRVDEINGMLVDLLR